jgi:small conductance mechanosensitive channel
MRLQDHLDKFEHLLIEYTPHVITAFIVLIVGLQVIKWVSRIAQRSFEKRNLDISLRTFLKSLISIGLKIVLIVTVAGMVGIGTTSFVTILGAAGLAVGLALQGSLSNFAGGVLIMIFKPYKVGDTIEAQGQAGEVLEIQIFNTILLTGEHKTVIFPNGMLSNGTIINITRHGNIRTEIQVGVSTENNIDAVKQLIREVVENNEKILLNPAPLITVSKIADGAVNFSIKPYCHPDHTGTVVSEVNESLKVLFEKKNIKAAIPSRIIHNINA